MDFYLILGLTVVIAAFLTKRITKRHPHPRLVEDRERTTFFKPFNPQPVPNAMDIDSINEDLIKPPPVTPMTPGSPMSDVSSEDYVLDTEYIKWESQNT